MVLDVKQKHINLIESLVITIIVAIIMYFLLQGIIVDVIDDYLKSSVFVEKISILSYIVFIYSVILFVSLLISSIIFVKNKAILNKTLYANLLSLILTIVYMSFISFLFAGYGLRYYFNNITLFDKIFGFYLWNSYFIAYILQSSTPYFILLVTVYCFGYVLFFTLSTSRSN